MIIGRHTGQAIKQQFDSVCQEFHIAHKTYKIVADQAANVKAALGSIEEADDIVQDTMALLRRQRAQDKIKERERHESEQQAQLIANYNKEVDESNANGVTISRVYPSIKMLQSNLISNLNSYIYTINLRNKLFESLNSRFSGLIDQDVFVVSTFLDPNFGLSAFPTGEKALVKSIIKRLCEACVESNSLSMSSSSSSVNNCKKKSKYIFHNDNTVVVVENEVDKSMNDYIRLTQESENEIEALLFWKINESIYPILAKLAKKYLSVQASSAAVERMFSICGHIFSLKRRRLCVKFYSDLVLLILNEQLI